ncbi:MAG TPA: flagellar biosynthesis anti-sigma factor FlgM [Capsulimonadaceae bacterium]|nr:flagellar biosynthesis anti-sigma factor FlgM [Capsulimonadaceae bacterium]
MRIQGDESVRATQVSPATSVSGQGSSGQAGGAGSSEGSPAATVDFSSQAQQIQSAKAAVNAVPDVREDLVASLKQRVDSGTYHVKASDIADMMLRRTTADQIK